MKQLAEKTFFSIRYLKSFLTCFIMLFFFSRFKKHIQYALFSPCSWHLALAPPTIPPTFSSCNVSSSFLNLSICCRVIRWGFRVEIYLTHLDTLNLVPFFSLFAFCSCANLLEQIIGLVLILNFSQSHFALLSDKFFASR